jgi:hypothetical protein
MGKRYFPTVGGEGGSDWREKRELRGKKFFCERLQKKLDIYVCHTDYTDANALKKEDNPCFECPQGCKNRRKLSEAP